MSTDAKTLREISYGGVVVRGSELLAITPRGRSHNLLALPKGGADPDEAPEDTTAREVREEAGVEVRVREEVGRVDYWYRRSGRRIFKSVHFYLCGHVSGDPQPDGVEVSQASWIPLEEAPRRLAYKGERDMAARALSILSADR